MISYNHHTDPWLKTLTLPQLHLFAYIHYTAASFWTNWTATQQNVLWGRRTMCCEGEIAERHSVFPKVKAEISGQIKTRRSTPDSEGKSNPKLKAMTLMTGAFLFSVFEVQVFISSPHYTWLSFTFFISFVIFTRLGTFWGEGLATLNFQSSRRESLTHNYSSYGGNGWNWVSLEVPGDTKGVLGGKIK